MFEYETHQKRVNERKKEYEKKKEYINESKIK